MAAEDGEQLRPGPMTNDTATVCRLLTYDFSFVQPRPDTHGTRLRCFLRGGIFHGPRLSILHATTHRLPLRASISR